MGDARGSPWEGIAGPVRFEIPACPILSDDTQPTLATCQSIIEYGCVDPGGVASHLSRWYAAKRVHGLGSNTLKAMRDLAIGVHWALAGAKGEFAAGNEAAMRVAPLAFLLDPKESRDRMLIRDVLRITHHNDEAYVGARRRCASNPVGIGGNLVQRSRLPFPRNCGAVRTRPSVIGLRLYSRFR